MIRNPTGTLEHLHVPGSEVPGPPLQSMGVADNEVGLIEATSNDGASAAWP